jgi:hypothetical protein|tara:strand:+ start:1838 stop:2227 length:390 start_codon:yes stop_codon:yes gene_type:complete
LVVLVVVLTIVGQLHVTLLILAAYRQVLMVETLVLSVTEVHLVLQTGGLVRDSATAITNQPEQLPLQELVRKFRCPLTTVGCVVVAGLSHMVMVDRMLCHLTVAAAAAVVLVVWVDQDWSELLTIDKYY